MSNPPLPASAPSGPPPWPPGQLTAPRRRWPLFAVLIVALVATLAVAIVGWFRPVPTSKPPAAPTYTSQQVADAKAKVCAAYEKVHEAVQTNFARDKGTDPNQQLLVAVTGQQALVAGSVYLQTTLSEQPAAPPDLTAAVRKLIDVFQSLTIEYLNGRGSPDVDPSLRAGDEATLAIEGICK